MPISATSSTARPPDPDGPVSDPASGLDEPDPARIVEALGGLATRAQLAAHCRRGEIEKAVKAHRIVRVNRSLYRLPSLDRALRLAAEARGQVALLDAALAHGWEIALAPTRPCVKVARGARALSTRAQVIWGETDASTGLVTSRRLTVIDCARRLPLRDALPVLDSALRHGYDADVLHADAHAVRGKGSVRARRAAEAASALAHNPFESRLRALAIEAGLSPTPQCVIPIDDALRGVGDPAEVRPDLVDRGRRLVLEADSWEFHTGKEVFQADCWRYTALTAGGWTVLRFTWWQVMHHPGWVLGILSGYATAD